MKTHKHSRHIFYLLFFSHILLSCDRAPKEPNYFPETGKNAIYQRALDLQNGIDVLSIALEPGFEDLNALAYFRLGRGARVTSAYITNGEAGESDVRGEYPHRLAAIRRQEANDALTLLGCDPYFLNMPDIAAARDSIKINKLWQPDSLRMKLAKLIAKAKPDIILIARDWKAHARSWRNESVLYGALAAVKNVSLASKHDTLQAANGIISGWNVDRVFFDDRSQKGLAVPVDEEHPFWNKKYRAIGEEALQKYESIAVQRNAWFASQEPSYTLVYPSPRKTIEMVDAGLPKPAGERLQGANADILRLTEKVMNGDRSGVLVQIAALLDSVAIHLGMDKNISPQEKRTLLAWNKGLDNLRCSILGVEVKYTISDTALTESQLTFLTIKEVAGISGKGETFIYFGGLDERWGVNEAFERTLPLEFDAEYRLLTPKNLKFTSPAAIYGLNAERVDEPIYFFIIHRAEKRERSFTHRTAIKIARVPRFLVEVLTPIVKMAPGERIDVRITNHSRDGVLDTLKINHEYATSAGNVFRLNNKDESVLATIFPHWKGKPADGNYVMPLEIHGMEVANFAVKKFSAIINKDKRIGLVLGIVNSPLQNALRRLNAKFAVIEINKNFEQRMDSLDVLFIDRRATTLKPQISEQRGRFDKFVTEGGHLIILSQDALAWNSGPLWDNVHLESTQYLEESEQLVLDTEHAFLSSPNSMAIADWEGWANLRAYNNVSVVKNENTEIPVRIAENGLPSIVTEKTAQGRKTYVDLALDPQLLNVHAGAYRLLANLISN